MADAHHPIRNPAPRPHRAPEEHFTSEEVALAGRNNAMPLEGLRYDVTPTGMHYLLIHFDIPFVPKPEAWRLNVKGKVARALSLSLADIRSMPSKTLRVTLECAGNGRKLYAPRWPSMPWAHEAVGTSEWTGTPLSNVLEAAGMSRDAVEVAFIGLDRGLDKGLEHNYGRSLVRELALSPDVLLAHSMNGAPLLPQHGFPLRLVVPGWFGMASVKWLDSIEVLDRPYDGYQQVGTYHYKSKVGEKGTPITHMRVKSLIVPPGMPCWYERQSLVEPGKVVLEGRAWSGNGVPVERVDVAINGVWQAATLEPKQHKWAWQGWRTEWMAASGDYEIACRATDAGGAVQPEVMPWDVGGFGNNSIQRIKVTVR